MNWYKNLYMGETARKERHKIIYSVDRHKLYLGAYVLTLAANGTDLIDIIPAFLLRPEQVKDPKFEIIGIAVTKEEAMELSREIIMDVYEKTGSFDVRGYFS